MLRTLAERLGRRAAQARELRLPNLHLPDLHLPDLHLRDLQWEDVARMAQGRPVERETKTSVILPAVLTLAGAGAAFWWWRQWARGRAEVEAPPSPADTSSPSEAATTGPEVHPTSQFPTAPEVQPALDAALAVQGAAAPTVSTESPA